MGILEVLLITIVSGLITLQGNQFINESKPVDESKKVVVLIPKGQISEDGIKVITTKR